jgi:probable HAF family extracellular repeat protein
VTLSRSASRSIGSGTGMLRRRRRYAVEVIAIDGALHDLDCAGALVGQATTPGGVMRAVRVTDDGTDDLGTLGGSAASARGTNDHGAIVGGSLTAGDERYHAFLYEDGVMHDLNAFLAADAGCELLQALGINNDGDIVAIGCIGGIDRVVRLRRLTGED